MMKKKRNISNILKARIIGLSILQKHILKKNTKSILILQEMSGKSLLARRKQLSRFSISN